MSTVWYNYALASADTIIDKDTTSSNPVTNNAPATESICPKGWTLPSKIQTDSQRNIDSFSPVVGGLYATNGTLEDESTRGAWWSSQVYKTESVRRYMLGRNVNISNLYTSYALRFRGLYIRCINKQKTVLDLTYMQEMTPKIESSLTLILLSWLSKL